MLHTHSRRTASQRSRCWRSYTCLVQSKYRFGVYIDKRRREWSIIDCVIDLDRDGAKENGYRQIERIGYIIDWRKTNHTHTERRFSSLQITQ